MSVQVPDVLITLVRDNPVVREAVKDATIALLEMQVEILNAKLATVNQYAAAIAANSSLAAVPFERWYEVWHDMQIVMDDSLWSKQEKVQP